MASKGAKTSAEIAWRVASKAEPKVSAALVKLLRTYQNTVQIKRIEAHLIQGDLSGLFEYLDAEFGAAFRRSQAAVVLAQTMADAGIAAEASINAAVSQGGVTMQTQIPTGTGPAQIVLPSPEFKYNPTNPHSVAATRSWMGNLIRQMALKQRQVVMSQVEQGIKLGQNPRTTARSIRRGLGLTRVQNGHVLNFEADLDRIVTGGMRSAQSWGIYTPKQIAVLKAKNPAKYKQLNFTSREIKEGRRWAKISRSAGTLQFDPKTGLKASKPIGFVEPRGTQGGENAFRIGPDGKPIDHMSRWRMRDKTFDPHIYRVVEAEEALQDALASGDPKAVGKAQAQRTDALMKLETKKQEMVDRYREKYTKHRSQVIARTETMRAANLGSLEAWRQSVQDSDLFAPEEVRRYWISARDDRVRLHHRSADLKYGPDKGKQTVGLNEPFIIEGHAVLFPPHGPNCRCTVGYDVEL